MIRIDLYQQGRLKRRGYTWIAQPYDYPPVMFAVLLMASTWLFLASLHFGWAVFALIQWWIGSRR